MPTTRTAAGTNGGSPVLKMKDLERATGVGREAIRFYIHSGLLPQPQRHGRNVAFYDPSFIERIRLIKELQQKRFLPLRVIKAIVEGDTALAPAEVQTLTALDRHLLRAAGIDRNRPPVRLTEVAARTGVPPRDIRRLAAVEAITLTTRHGTQWLDDASVRIVELLAKLQSAGLTETFGFGPDKLRLYVDMVRWLAHEELRVFTRAVTGKADPERVRVMAEAAIEILNEVIGVLRTTVLLRSLAEGDIPARGNAPARKRIRPKHGRHR